jgi:Ca2+-binding EF-hand superfamily protein
MDPTVVAEVREEIEQLFNYFDNGQGSITAAEIFTTMKSIQPISIEKA